MTLALSGHVVESGIAVGQAHIIQHNELEIGEFRIDASQVNDEIKRLDQALTGARAHLRELADRLQETAGAGAGEIINTHIHMLRDSRLVDASADHIANQLCNAEWALQVQLEALLLEFRSIDDDYIRSREDDTVQVVRMVQQFLAEDRSEQPLSGVPDRLGQTLVVANELTPGELAILHQRGVAGVVTEHGSPHSHTAIIARSLSVPTVMGVRRAQALIQEGEQLILDGHYGIVFADPEDSILAHYLRKQTETDRFRLSLEAVRERETASIDGQPVKLMANTERSEDMRMAMVDGAEGVGLFRSEFLYLQGQAPSEEAQLETYERALDALEGASLTIRTLDLGADKTADLLDFQTLRSNPNPALGLRAVRLCLREMELFKTQLRAILRASATGPVRCLIPMLTSAQEVQAVHTLLDETRGELDAAGEAYDPDMPIGGMIEVPAAALALESLCKGLDFISVGTNDLIQYALAADRVDEHVAHLYDPQHPGVVRLLMHIFETAGRLGIPFAVCGELAGDRRYTRLLLAMGLREFSMQPRHLLEVKRLITETHIDQLETAFRQWHEADWRNGGANLVQFLDQSQTKR